ncbi:phosphohistidine phosphatase SixA [Marinobacterium zhoushanense]|uniref:Phosphohistidine phosphatase SixA n=1 Tax=Marinobacterium zhoushanense TaxID=1679163 RepID=A0ABQ1KB91_9GAMM|nr:hypothetical protein [Marinobacterium zhoushanense]GGB90275.1 phosphohistidine phosphatase SixA [Marinobacterium zhoushanense]
MRLMLMRHCEAVVGRDSDSERPVTAAALAHLYQSASALREPLGRVSWLVSSPWRRARETAEALLPFLSLSVQQEISDLLLPQAVPGQTLTMLERYFTEGVDGDTSLLLVGHQPLVGRLIGLLCEGDSGAGFSPTPGEIAVIELDWPAAGMGSLRHWCRL